MITASFLQREHAEKGSRFLRKFLSISFKANSMKMPKKTKKTKNKCGESIKIVFSLFLLSLKKNIRFLHFIMAAHVV